MHQSHGTNQNFGPSEDVVDIPMEDEQANQDDISDQPAIDALPALHSILPNTFSPQRHQPYATLRPLERAIMKYMCPHRGHQVLIAELAQEIQVLCGCSEFQFG